MQDCPDIHHIELGPRATERQDGFFEPVIELVTLLRVTHQLIVLDIIEHSQVRTIRAMAQTTQLFTTTGDLNLNVVAGENCPGLPDAAAARRFREIHQQAGVKLQFRLYRLQHRIGLVDGVHNDDRVMLDRQHNAPDDKKLTHDCGFGFTTRSRYCIVLAPRGLDDFRQALVEIVMQFAAGGMANIVREIMLHKVFKPRYRVCNEAATFSNCRCGGVKAHIFRFNGATETGGEFRQFGKEVFAG